MAVYNLPNYTNEQGFGLPLNIRRGNPNPLDNSSVWQSLAAAQNYAQNDPTAYVGQIISVVSYIPAVTNDEGEITAPSQSTVEVYYIKDEAGTLEPVGTSPVGDEGTIDVAEDGTVSLYGIAGLALTREEEDGSTVNITYQPLYVNGKLTWVEPSATTVEGLAAEIEGLKTRISALETAVGNAEGGLVKDVADHGDAIEAINEKIGEVEEGKTVAEMIADAKYVDTEVKAGIEANAKAIDALELLVSDTPVSEQIETAVATEKERAEGIESGLENRLKAVEEDYLKASDKTELSEAIEAAEENAVDRVLGYLAEEVVNEKYDTLKEVAAWIESDTTNSAKLIERVSAIEEDYLKDEDKTELQDAIGDLEAFVGAIPVGSTSETVVGYVQEAIAGLKIEDYAKAADLTTLSGHVDDEFERLVGETPVSEQIETAVAGMVAKVEGSRLMTEAEGAKLAGIAEGAQVNAIDSVDEEQFAIDENKRLTLLDLKMARINGLADALAGKVDKVEGSRLLTEDEATKLEKLVLGENGEVSVSGKVAAGNVDGLDAWITNRAGSLNGLSENNLTDTLLTKINGVAEGAQVNVIDEVSGEFTIEGKVLSIKTIEQEKITGLVDALAGKVDAEEGYRLMSEDEHEKLAQISAGAQVNVLEGVKLGDTMLEIVDKVATIPVGAGLKASDEVTIGEDGTLGIGSINAGKLVQADGEFLILNGGSAV